MLLSKSKFLIGIQCPVWLWKVFNAPDQLPAIDAATQAKFDIGNKVGAIAQKLYPNGSSITTASFSANLDQTKQLLNSKKTLFEPGFMVDDLFARADILLPAGEHAFDLIEVKSSTSVKDLNLYDLAFQKHVLEKAGLSINRTILLHLNNQYVRQGPLDPEQLFTRADVTEQVNTVQHTIPELIRQQRMIIKQPTCPTIQLTDQCAAAYGCPVHDELYAQLPKGNVFELYCAKAKAQELYQAGVKELNLIPASTKLNKKQAIQLQATRTHQPIIDQDKINTWLRSLTYPLYYLDFETAQFAIPQYDHTKPYQQLPVQFSLHIQQEDGTITHQEYLHDGRDDPRPDFAQALKALLQGAGNIIIYNKSFEQGRLQELATTYPEHAEWIQEAITKMVDLLVPFKNFWYYHPAQRGSCSLKATMPALLGKDYYKELEVHDGGTAQLEYMRITYQDVTDEEKQNIRTQLLKYCQLDTEGMIWMIDKLQQLSHASTEK